MAVSLQQAVPAKGEAKQDCCLRTELLREEGKAEDRPLAPARPGFPCPFSPPLPTRPTGPHGSQRKKKLIGGQTPALRVTGELPDAMSMAASLTSLRADTTQVPFTRSHVGWTPMSGATPAGRGPCDRDRGTSRRT